MSKLVAALSQMVASQGAAYNWAGATPAEENVQIFPIWLLGLVFETHILEISPEMGPFGQFTFKYIVVSS